MKYIVGKSSKSIQLFAKLPSPSCLEMCLIICHLPTPGTFSTRPTGEQQKKPPKMVATSFRINGPDMWPAATSSKSSWSIILGCKFAEGRLPGKKEDVRGGGLPIGEPYEMSSMRLGKEDNKLLAEREAFQA